MQIWGNVSLLMWLTGELYYWSSQEYSAFFISIPQDTFSQYSTILMSFAFLFFVVIGEYKYRCWISVDVSRISSLDLNVDEYIDVAEDQTLVPQVVSFISVQSSFTKFLFQVEFFLMFTSLFESGWCCHCRNELLEFLFNPKCFMLFQNLSNVYLENGFWTQRKFWWFLCNMISFVVTL